MSENSEVGNTATEGSAVPLDRQARMITLRLTLGQYDEVVGKAAGARLSINSWLLLQLGFDVPRTQHPRGRKPGGQRQTVVRQDVTPGS